jgi:hypothetical protein
MKIKNVLFAAAGTFLATSAFALDIPQGESVHWVYSKPDSMEGRAVSSVWNSTNTTYLPVHVVSHVEYRQEGSQNPVTTNVGGVLSTASIVQSGGSKLEVCYNNQIPSNTEILVYDESWSSYFVHSVEIPSYRNDRVCMNVPYQNMWVNGVSTTSAKFMLILK